MLPGINRLGIRELGTARECQENYKEEGKTHFAIHGSPFLMKDWAQQRREENDPRGIGTVAPPYSPESEGRELNTEVLPTQRAYCLCGDEGENRPNCMEE